MKKNRSVCPIASAMDIFGDKWTLVVIRDFFAGKSLYSELLNSPEKISTNILSNRLKLLEEHRLIQVTGKHARTGKAMYALTDKGKSLYPVLDVVANWALENIPGTQKMVSVPAQ